MCYLICTVCSEVKQVFFCTKLQHNNTDFLSGSANCEVVNSGHPALDVSPSEPHIRGGGKRSCGSSSTKK
jgi:hypothetical protein